MIVRYIFRNKSIFKTISGMLIFFLLLFFPYMDITKLTNNLSELISDVYANNLQALFAGGLSPRDDFINVIVMTVSKLPITV